MLLTRPARGLVSALMGWFALALEDRYRRIVSAKWLRSSQETNAAEHLELSNWWLVQRRIFLGAGLGMVVFFPELVPEMLTLLREVLYLVTFIRQGDVKR